MAKMIIEVEYEVDGDGCSDPEFEVLKAIGGAGKVIVEADYEIFIQSLEIKK